MLESIKEQIKQHFKDKPFRYRIWNGVEMYTYDVDYQKMIMPDTGCRDKNDHAIYEMDLIYFGEDLDLIDVYSVYIVIYDYEQAYYNLQELEDFIDGKMYNGQMMNQIGDQFQCQDGIIIGNIFEYKKIGKTNE